MAQPMRKIGVPVGAFLSVTMLALASFLPSHAQKATAEPGQQLNALPPSNPLKVALLKWYFANTTTSFAVGRHPLGVAFDGASVKSCIECRVNLSHASAQRRLDFIRAEFRARG